MRACTLKEVRIHVPGPPKNLKPVMDSKSKHFKVLDLLFTMISSIDQYSLVRPGWSPNSSLAGPKLNSIFKVLNFFEDPGS